MNPMWWTLGLSLSIVSFLFVLWYGLSLRWNRRRAQKLLANIESAFLGHGHVCGVEWRSASEFLVHLRVAGCAFTHPNILVRMFPRQIPFRWALARLRKRRETMTFEANLHYPPGFNLEVQNQRWLVTTKVRMPRKNSVVRMKQLGPFVLTSRRDWERDITNMVQALSSSRGCNLLSVSFRKSAPHFSATVPLEAIAGPQCSPDGIFDALRELASGASTAKF
jgi:hypothetical protein